MSQRSAHDAFVPFDPGPPPASTPAASAGKTPPPPPPLQVTSRPDAKPAFTPVQPRAATHGHGHPNSGQPVVTLQRDGDRVIGIRIECLCGQVIELACSYDQNPLAP